ncbi:MAG: DUF4062 domain-containing protein [Acidobacteria bacterium]|nr:DUF4062 domain-containing protein [Acidobacteriota bacterium]
MAAQRIRVMISSRCNDPIELDGTMQRFSDLRRRAKQEIESATLFGLSSFDCWINEDASVDGGQDIWDACLDEVRKCDILLVLYDGDAGWTVNRGGIGICHAELQAALDAAPGKVRLIRIENPSPAKADRDAARRNKLFADYLERQSRMYPTAHTGEEALDRIREALQDGVVGLVQLGGREARKGRFDSGSSLDWSRLDYLARKAQIERCVREAMDGSPRGQGLLREVDGQKIYFRCHGVPAAMSIAAAREMIGRPFLHDHEAADDLADDAWGPVHVIGCHRGVTENQATAMLGFPDATIVTPPFGVYVADNVQKVQLALLANCRDESSTRHAVQRFLDWLHQSGEEHYLTERARGRRNIVRAIAAESGEADSAARAGRR